ncbi:MAG: hypothetical protein NZ578_08035 [Candidatus Binatia bacterium]|nr:hypothetical protein [Candidatus Binatia bacterium]
MCARLEVAYRPFLAASLGDCNGLTEENGTELMAVAVLPEQVCTSRAAHTPGVTALMRAVLNDALVCYRQQFLSHSRRAHRLAREAEDWLFCDDDRWPFSFVNVCAVLGIEPTALRRRIVQWSQRPAGTLRRQRRLKPDHRLLLAA